METFLIASIACLASGLMPFAGFGLGTLLMPEAKNPRKSGSKG